MKIETQANLAMNSLANSATTAISPSKPGFAKAMAQVQRIEESPVRVIQSGDTLTSIVREQAQRQGVKLSLSEEFKWTQALAADSGIKNPNAIFPGQKIQLSNMLAQWQSGQTQPPQAASETQASTKTLETVVVTASRTPSVTSKTSASMVSAHPVLNKTLDRAVERGFIPKNEKQDVFNKILQVAQKHNFLPDDFARLTLMESDGMNPQATNTRCHGIIQFCDGPDRGAAEVGFGKSPKSILGLSVYQQLHLVDTYFDKVGLKKEGKVALDELYLAVLQPAARGEKRPDEPLGIPGKQAKYLYEGKDPLAPMTRVSIAQGLMQNAADRLGLNQSKNQTIGLTSMASDSPAVQAARIKIQIQKAADYEAIEAPSKVWLR